MKVLGARGDYPVVERRHDKRSTTVSVLLTVAAVAAFGCSAAEAHHFFPLTYDASDDPDAVKVVQASWLAYTRLQDYSDTTTTNLNDAKVSIAISSTGNYRYEANLTDETGHRVHLLAVHEASKYDRIVDRDQSHYYESSEPDFVDQQAASDSSLGILLVGFWQAGQELQLLDDVTGRERARVTNLKLAKPEITDDVPVDMASCDLFTQGIERSYAPHVTLWIGKKDHLIRQVLSAQGTYVVMESHRNVSTAPPPPSVFKFAPPPGVTRGDIDRLHALEHEQPPPYYPELRVGSPSVSFTAVSVDGRRIDSKSSAGRVLVLGFWPAETCGDDPSEVVALDDLYKSLHSQGLDAVVFFEDCDSLRLPTFVAQNRIMCPLVADRDPSSYIPRVGSLYGVSNALLNIVIGRDGRIAAIGAADESLKAAVEKALAAD